MIGINSREIGNGLKQQKSQSEPKKIVELLRQKISWLELKPESILNISELAEKFNVSRTPVKEALINLKANGWVQRQGSHFTVTPLSLQRMCEITEGRSVIENQAYLWAMKRLTDDEAQVLYEYEEEIEKIDANATKKEALQLDLKFHLFLFRAAKNRYVFNLSDVNVHEKFENFCQSKVTH